MTSAAKSVRVRVSVIGARLGFMLFGAGMATPRSLYLISGFTFLWPAGVSAALTDVSQPLMAMHIHTTALCVKVCLSFIDT